MTIGADVPNSESVSVQDSDETIVLNSQSLGNALDYSVQSDPAFGLLYGKRPQFDPYKAYNIIKNDPVVKGALISILDKFLMANWRVVKEDKYQSNLEKQLRELRFQRFLKQLLTQALLFKNAFVEVVKKGEEVISLNVVETAFMKINTKTNGDVISYSQYIGNVSTHNLPEWAPEEMVQFKLDAMNTNAWADSDFLVLYDTVLIKDYARQFVLWLFSSNQLRPVISVETKMNQTKANDFLSWMKATEKDLRRPILLEGKLSVQALYDFSKSGGSIKDFMDWCDNQILQLLQVPPIAMGKADSTGRSNSVEQYTAFDTRIRSIQLMLEEFFNYDLFPIIPGFDQAQFKFETVDFNRTKEVISMIQEAKNAQMTDEAIKELMGKYGLCFETEDVFKDPVEMAEEMSKVTNKDVGSGNEGSLGHKNSDLMPSRKRQDNSSVSKANKSVQIKNASAGPNPAWVYDAIRD